MTQFLPPRASRRRAKPFALAAASLLALAQAAPAQSPGSGDDDCAPDHGHVFLCGAGHPEDLATLEGTPWLIASGFATGSGLKLVDRRSRSLRRWYSGDSAQRAPEPARFPDCPGPPDAALMNVQGMHLDAVGTGTWELLATNHGGREAIEVFRVTLAGGQGAAAAPEPVLQWLGCVPMPGGMAANSVARLPGGGLLATVLLVPGAQMADYVERRVTGRVYEWQPGWRGMRHVRGADLPGNNGIEASADGREFYVVAFGWHEVLAFSHTSPARVLRRSVAPGFMPDNIHWQDGQLVAAGMQFDEPACGGVRKVIEGKADPMACHRGYTVARLDPRTMAWRIVAYAEPNPSFNGVSTGLVIARELWLGSWQSDRLAVRELPGL
jgi:hypothetical protein